MKIETKKLEVKNLEKKKYRSDRVRDHLANERTYLAWMRSGIALMGFGVLIVRLRIISPPLAPQPPGNGWKLGLAFAVVGVLTVLLSTQHYFAVRRDIDEDTYQPPDRWILLASLAVVILGMGVLYYVFTVPLDYLNTFILE
ncbi:YidH family protein [Anabaena sp. WFMT]|uniref:YidH family protein n=1 Tax=Anabaena sp. WFMT TaxID=3449730 RepID=UPI003F25DF6D